MGAILKNWELMNFLYLFRMTGHNQLSAAELKEKLDLQEQEIKSLKESAEKQKAEYEQKL